MHVRYRTKKTACKDCDEVHKLKNQLKLDLKNMQPIFGLVELNLPRSCNYFIKGMLFKN